MAEVDAPTGLVIPTAEELMAFKNASLEDFGVTDAQVGLFLRLAADWLIIRTNLKRAPDPNSSVGRIVKYGIMDLAWYVGVSQDNWVETFSPFSSETIGSYNYSKTLSAIRGKKDLLDAPLFDAAVEALLGLDDSGNIATGISYSSEQVMPRTYQESEWQALHPGSHRNSFYGSWW